MIIYLFNNLNLDLSRIKKEGESNLSTLLDDCILFDFIEEKEEESKKIRRRNLHTRIGGTG